MMIANICVVCGNGRGRGSIEMRHEPSRFNPRGNPIGVHTGKCHAQYEESAQEYRERAFIAAGRAISDFMPYSGRCCVCHELGGKMAQSRLYSSFNEGGGAVMAHLGACYSRHFFDYLVRLINRSWWQTIRRGKRCIKSAASAEKGREKI